MNIGGMSIPVHLLQRYSGLLHVLITPSGHWPLFIVSGSTLLAGPEVTPLGDPTVGREVCVWGGTLYNSTRAPCTAPTEVSLNKLILGAPHC